MEFALHRSWSIEGRPSTGRFRELLTEPYRAVNLKEMKDPKFFIEFIQYVDQAVDENPRKGIGLARVAVMLAKRIGERCLLVRATGALMSAHSSLGEYSRANALFDWILPGTLCPHCVGDLYREHGRTFCLMGALADALSFFNRSITSFEHAGVISGVGRGLLGRGITYWNMKMHRAALADTRNALTVLHPARECRHFRAALSNLAMCLASTGDEMDLREAMATMPQVWEMFRNVRLVTAERACVRWVEGNIAGALGLMPLARRRLRTTQGNFATFKMPYEVSALAVDISALEYPDRKTIREIFRILILWLQSAKESTMLEKAEAVFDATRRVTNLPFDWQCPAGGDYMTATCWDPTGRIRKALEDVRATAGKKTRLFPQLIPWGASTKPYLRPNTPFKRKPLPGS